MNLMYMVSLLVIRVKQVLTYIRKSTIKTTYGTPYVQHWGPYINYVTPFWCQRRGDDDTVIINITLQPLLNYEINFYT